MKHLKKYNHTWLKIYLEQSHFDADLICGKLEREQNYSEELLRAIVEQASVEETCHNGLLRENTSVILREIYNKVNGLTPEQGLEVEKAYKETYFKGETSIK